MSCKGCQCQTCMNDECDWNDCEECQGRYESKKSCFAYKPRTVSGGSETKQ